MSNTASTIHTCYNNSEILHLCYCLSHLPRRFIYLQTDMSANTSSSSSSIVSAEGMTIRSFSNLDLYLINPLILRPNCQSCPRWRSAVSICGWRFAEIERLEFHRGYERDWLATRWSVHDPPFYCGLLFWREGRSNGHSEGRVMVWSWIWLVRSHLWAVSCLCRMAISSDFFKFRNTDCRSIYRQWNHFLDFP